jgi:DNA-damage-inducible protein D
MTDLTLIDTADLNPFDAIKTVRADGSVFWSARDLQPLMGYATWAKFMTPVRRAMKAAENTEMDLEQNFSQSGKVSGDRGPDQLDYDLTREAAYLVAMNGDPNKDEVAAAQRYFVAMTMAQEQTEREARAKIEVEAPAMTGQQRVEAAVSKMLHGQTLPLAEAALARREKVLTELAQEIDELVSQESQVAADLKGIRGKLESARALHRRYFDAQNKAFDQYTGMLRKLDS